MTQARRYRTGVRVWRLGVPAHVIRGTADRVASARWCAHLARSPRVEVVSVPRAAHMVALTHPAVVAETIEHVRGSAMAGLLRLPAGASG